jgi:hypothetical protein
MVNGKCKCSSSIVETLSSAIRASSLKFVLHMHRELHAKGEIHEYCQQQPKLPVSSAKHYEHDTRHPKQSKRRPTTQP